MNCESAKPLLEAYLDNELDRADAREIEAHLDTCEACRNALSKLDDVRRALRDNALKFSAPPQLRDRIAATRLDGAARRPRWFSYAAACALAFFAGGVSMHLWNSPQHDQLAHDVFASHWRALAATSPIDVVSSDRHTVKPWFAGKVAQTPVVQDFADHGFALYGGRVDYVGDTRVPVLVYKHGQHIIDVFVLPNGTSLSPSMEQGYRLDTVNLGEQPAAVVSDMDAAETEKLKGLLRGE
jgi:anti-sigma factor (TIGR02949 family)